MRQVTPTETWRNPETHFLEAVNSPWYRCLCKIQNEISFATFEFYRKLGIETLHLPVTTGSISSPMGLGSDSSPVRVELFGQKTYLADSMQFMLEYGCRMIPNGCFYVMPSFRGEAADASHLCQFYHSEAEIPGTLDDVKNLVESYVKFLCRHLLKNCEKEIISAAGQITHVEKLLDKSRFISIKLDDAVRYLKSEEFVNYNSGRFRTLTRKGEQELIRQNDGFLWLTNFDDISVPFYQADDQDNIGTCKNADFLFGIGEVIGAGERHVDSRQVIQALDRREVATTEYEWYIQMKEKFPLQTSGFGMGIERFILWLTQTNDIRNCQLLLRFNGMNILP